MSSRNNQAIGFFHLVRYWILIFAFLTNTVVGGDDDSWYYSEEPEAVSSHKKNAVEGFVEWHPRHPDSSPIFVADLLADGLPEAAEASTFVADVADATGGMSEEENDPARKDDIVEVEQDDEGVEEHTSRPRHPAPDKRRGTFHKWFQRVRNSMPHSMVFADKRTDTANYNNDVASSESNPKSPRPTKKKILNKRRAFEAFRFMDREAMEETMAGARLLSGSFHLLATTAGFVANSVRVSGDTTAGIMGSSVKVFGTAVKSVGTGLAGASRILEPKVVVHNNDNNNGGGGTTSSSNSRADDPHNPSHSKIVAPPEQQKKSQDHQQSSSEVSIPLTWRQRQKKRRDALKNRSRRLAAKSVRLVGNVIGGVGESLLIAGVAAESVASSTAGVAEETVRVLENLAASVSVAISLRGQRKRRGTPSPITSPLHPLRRKFIPSYISFGQYEDTGNVPSSAEVKETLRARLAENPSIQDAKELIEMLLADTVRFGREVSADVEGVPSMAGELFAALLFCYLVSLLVLSPARRQKTEMSDSSQRIEKTPSSDRFSETGRFQFGISLKWPRQRNKKDGGTVRIKSLLHVSLYSCRRVSLFFIMLPYRVFRWSLFFVIRIVFNRKTCLFGTYCLVWTYLSRLSRQKALLVQRRAEATGFRNGMPGVTEPSESTLWLNHVLNSFWRIRATGDLEVPHEYRYPIFVSRGFPQVAEGGSSYGGLEPYIASLVGEGIVKSLELTESITPTNVAYVSLFSLSLGGRPPVLRRLRLGELVKQGGSTRMELELDVDALLEDLSLVLEVKLSSLSYALLPSTKIRIHNLDFRASLRAVLELDPNYPFVSTIELSLTQQPVCNFRVTPVSNDSGLKGVDLGSIPFINDWIQDAIKAALSTYVTPRFISLDLTELSILRSERSGMMPVGPVDIRNLRRKSRFSISQPRTSTPDGIAITSVANKLDSHQLFIQEFGSQNLNPTFQGSKKKKPILRPVTELSRLALDMYAIKEDNLVRPVTELARLGMDRWLASEVLAKREEADGLLGIASN